MRRIIQRTITTINITSFIYVEESSAARTAPNEPTLDLVAGHPMLIPSEQPGDEGQALIQT